MHINNKSLMRLYAVFGVSIVVGYFAASALKDQNEDRSEDSYAQNVTDNKDELDSVTEDINLDSILHNNPDSISKEDDDVEKPVDDVIEISDIGKKDTEEISNPSDEVKNTVNNSESQIRKRQDQDEEEEERKNEENRLKEEPTPGPAPVAPKPITIKQSLSAGDAQSILRTGNKNDMIPEGCRIVINGSEQIEYQNFRIGVKSKSYSNIRVESIDFDDNGKVRSISISAIAN